MNDLDLSGRVITQEDLDLAIAWSKAKFEELANAMAPLRAAIEAAPEPRRSELRAQLRALSEFHAEQLGRGLEMRLHVLSSRRAEGAVIQVPKADDAAG